MLALLFLGRASAADLDYRTLSLIPIQAGGREKPLDTFARESVRLVTGHETFEGQSSMAVMLDWVAHPKDWEEKPFILIDNLELKDLIGVPKEQRRVSPKFLVNHEGFIAYAKSNFLKQQRKMTLDPKEKESLTVFGRLQRYEDIKSGEALAVIPVPDPKTQKWGTLGDLNRAFHQDPRHVPAGAMTIAGTFADVLSDLSDKDAARFAADSRNLAGVLAQLGGADYPTRGELAREVHFNALKPFQWAWIIHLAAALLIGASFLLGMPVLFRAGFLAFLGGIGMSGYGFVLRCLIAGRPPVSNMYESLIWVTFGMTIFALIFELVFRSRYFSLAGSILAVVGFVLADNVPTVLDPSIGPIEPVLRSNFWLTIHVLTITLSYAAFFLSLGIGHACLWTIWKEGTGEKLKGQTRLLYRVVQVGVVLLAAGTILGGVWANYSWGRFWGWDPKETWALIALLGYVAILHGRLAGWLKEVGFTIGVVSAFLGVLMAWYGVNFVLGVGLHSYGFSKGGLPYVITFVVVEIVLVTMVGLRAKASGSKPV
ncbi:MAG TPA: cytochrome c biogenesis protein CcsA [bacterium]|nr:cytochrome c biogenesis protein CcsA [bacterium]